MTVPREYLRASKDFDKLLLDVRDTCMLQTTNQAYHTLRAVLHVFRSHLAVDDALTFAGVLPAVARAIFVEDWQPAETLAPFPSRDALTLEIKAIRPDHNLAPKSAISDVAVALWRSVDVDAFERVLSKLPEGARAYWATEERAAQPSAEGRGEHGR